MKNILSYLTFCLIGSPLFSNEETYIVQIDPENLFVHMDTLKVENETELNLKDAHTYVVTIQDLFATNTLTEK